MDSFGPWAHDMFCYDSQNIATTRNLGDRTVAGFFIRAARIGREGHKVSHSHGITLVKSLDSGFADGFIGMRNV